MAGTLSASSPQARRVGLFGGSFDPVHNAHVSLARVALAQLQLEEVRWIPAAQPWQKVRRLAESEHREAMLLLAIADEPRFRIERCELRRGGPSYTLDTVRELRSAEPQAQWFLIIGQDQYQGLHTWHGWQELLGSATLAVANRPGAAAAPNPQIQNTPHREVALPMMDVSSTDIRRRIAAGQSIAGLVPDAVASYIARHRLYQGPLRS
jgi:nicotinate-nucleotide adenylyltransferase